jgi:hypothetical protein
MYLGVMQQIAERLSQGLFSDPVTMTLLDVVFQPVFRRRHRYQRSATDPPTTAHIPLHCPKRIPEDALPPR